MNHKILLIAAIFTMLNACSNSDDNDTAPIAITGNVTTLAGSSQGFADGTGTTAQFYGPKGICIDPQGNLIIADMWNSKIRKVTLEGVVTTVAGSSEGYADDANLIAKFYGPTDVCMDASGNIFVCDNRNHKIRKISPTGYVTTFAGSTLGCADGVGSSAQFSNPSSMCFDVAGNLFVADSGNHRIRKITPAGIVTTWAGGVEGYADGTGIAAKFNYPNGICIDARNNLYITEFSNYKIRKISDSGEVTTIAGSSAGYLDAIGGLAQFSGLRAIDVDALGNLYVTDNSKIRKITPAGAVMTLAGSSDGFGDGMGTDAKFRLASNLRYHQGKIYVSDYGNNKIRVIE